MWWRQRSFTLVYRFWRSGYVSHHTKVFRIGAADLRTFFHHCSCSSLRLIRRPLRASPITHSSSSIFYVSITSHFISSIKNIRESIQNVISKLHGFRDIKMLYGYAIPGSCSELLFLFVIWLVSIHLRHSFSTDAKEMNYCWCWLIRAISGFMVLAQPGFTRLHVEQRAICNA